MTSISAENGAFARFAKLLTAGTALPLIMATPSLAQSAFQGSVTSATTGVQVTQAAGHDTITIGRSTAIIDWKPTDTATGGGPITFLPTGSTASFVGAIPGDYTVLNRINAADPSRIVAFSGAVESTVLSGANQVRGGSIWFYAPGGLLIGTGATFNVGSLLLTTNQIATTGTGANESFDPTVVNFSAPSGSKSAIAIQPGATINAERRIAMIAPRLIQGGAVRADGQIAYIAAETGKLTMPLSNGLFSIEVAADGGTEANAVAINHYGSTGRLHTVRDPSFKHAVYAVTVAKNSAVSMLLGGTIDDPANTASSSADAVVLSGGRNVIRGVAATDANGFFNQPVLGNAPVDIRITNAVIGSSVGAYSTGATALLASNGTMRMTRLSTFTAEGGVTAHAAAGGRFNGAGLTLIGRSTGPLKAGVASVTADGGGQMTFTGLLTVTADPRSVVSALDPNAIDSFGGAATIKADGGSISAQSLNLTAIGRAGSVDYTGRYGSATGGIANLLVRGGGSVTLGSAIVSARGDNTGGLGGSATSAGYDATGGRASVQVYDGSLTLTGTSPNDGSSLRIEAGGYAGPSIDGAAGRGGTASLLVAGGTVNSAQTVLVIADGIGGQRGTATTSGIGYGGTATVNIAAGTGAVPTQPTVTMRGLNLVASAGSTTIGSFNGEVSHGGDAYGGTASLAVGAGTTRIQYIDINATATGGYGLDLGGNGYAGRATMLVSGGSTTGYIVNSNANGTGGYGRYGTGGDGFAGTAQLLLTGGSMTVENPPNALGSKLTVSAIGTGGGSAKESDAGVGNGTGGIAKLALFNAGTRLTSGFTVVDASGAGGFFLSSGNGESVADGGTGTGGDASLSVYGGTANAGLTFVTARGTGGNGDFGSVFKQGGNGVGGTANVLATTGGTLRTVITVADAGAAGTSTFIDNGDPYQNVSSTVLRGGNATGGLARINAAGGTIISDSFTQILSDGVGGDGTVAGGNGTGGTTALVASAGGVVAASSVTLEAIGHGGAAPLPGKGKGGTATVKSTGGTVPASIVIDTSATP